MGKSRNDDFSLEVFGLKRKEGNNQFAVYNNRGFLSKVTLLSVGLISKMSSVLHKKSEGTKTQDGLPSFWKKAVWTIPNILWSARYGSTV